MGFDIQKGVEMKALEFFYQTMYPLHSQDLLPRRYSLKTPFFLTKVPFEVLLSVLGKIIGGGMN